MDGKTPQESTSSPVSHGEGQSTKFKSLDLADPKDVALLRSSVKRRWPGLDEARRADVLRVRQNSAEKVLDGSSIIRITTGF